jgi:poly-gamma-glutamate synthesis protein (capsule biosynthesis protein)
MAKVFACGDIVNYQNEDGFVCGYDMQTVINKADYAVCNFEAPVEGYGFPQPKSGACLAQPLNTVSGLKQQGFDLLLLANNHMLDYGKEGLTATLDAANKAGIDTTGAGVDEVAAYKPLVKKFGDIKVGIVNACEAQFGVIDHFEREEKAGYAWINHPKIDITVLALKKECDFILVFAHAGLENYSIPQKEWRVRYKHLCDLGADVVIGAHPHVPQGYENYNNSIIFYSLGNFYFDYDYARSYENHSFAILLDLHKGEPVMFEPVYHITKNKKVRVAERAVDLASLCARLDQGYCKEHDEMSLTAYEQGIRRNLLRSSTKLPLDTTLLGAIKVIVATLLGRRKRVNKPLTQLHYMRNETYYYAARHALELKNKKENWNLHD